MPTLLRRRRSSSDLLPLEGTSIRNLSNKAEESSRPRGRGRRLSIAPVGNRTRRRRTHSCEARTTTTTTSTTMSSNNKFGENNNKKKNEQDASLLWSCIARDTVILAEAGDDPYEGHVAATAKALLARRNTAGYEFHSHSVRNPSQQHPMMPRNPFAKQSQPQQQQEYTNAVIPKLRGVKFHVYERDDTHIGDNDDEPSSHDLIVWVFAAVYDADRCTRLQAQSFLEKMVAISQVFRETPEWKTGKTLSCQAEFAPILAQRMQEITYLGKMAMLEEHVEQSKQVMHENINLLLEREEKLSDLQAETNKLQEMASVFKKRTRRVRRLQMMQNAKHGFILGSAIVGTAAVVVVPPLVALL